MAYTNSSMVVYKKLSPNHSGQRTHSIDRITPHCVVGQCTAEGLGEWFEKQSTQASSNYGIDRDGRVALYVEEKNRSWCTSSNANDQRAITIECASDTTEPYAFRDVVYQTLIKLCIDICKRNGKSKLIWFGDKDKTLNYSPKSGEMILTVHRWFANKSCPGNWMYTEGIAEDLAKRIKEVEKSEEYEKEIEQIISGGGRMLTASEVENMSQSEEERGDRIEQEILASRIVVSLNIIYMFCDALRIMITNRHANIKIKNREVAEQYRRELLLIDDKLVHRVYANLGEQEMGMLEYRERNGIIPTSLSEQETEEENYRNSVFGEVLKNAISSLVESVDKKDEEGVLRTKALIREEILRYPECDEKERYTDWLDKISQKISDVLVARCQKEDDYQKIKDGIMSSLGEKASILPDSTVDSLTTAEMLYARYASEKYAEKGFDFSCISALYYQAFEEAYNLLIWRGYADELNALEVNGQKYTDILETCKGHAINPRVARGYLDSAPKQRNYYIDYRNASRPETKVSMRCMYKSFAILLQNIKPSTALVHFCDYIAKITGFSSSIDMFKDPDFMRNCNAFITAVDASADSRNNASHGGTFISVDQCKSDKKTVLSELEAVRSDSLGLIQQLIFLLRR